jgi:hypothetical protein
MGRIKSETRMDSFNLFCRVGIAINEIEQNDAGNAMEKNDAYRLKISIDAYHPRHTNY